MKKRKLAHLILAIGAVASLSGCNPNKNTEDELVKFNVDKQYVFGMTDLSYQEAGVNYEYTHKLFKNLGVKSVRIWMHCNWMLKSPTEYSTNIEKLRAIYNDIKDEGYQIIAMNHSNFHESGLANSASTTAKPARDLTAGSKYMKWLEDYEQTYYMMVKAFPDITYWEIDNECNNDAFMQKLGGGSFSDKEKAEVYYDMMYFASKGIHRANANAITVMGGIIMNGAEQFLNDIYDLIESENSWSNNPDDYFQVACWHPYMDVYSKNRFINLNNTIYNVVKTREGKDKKVFLTECGFSEINGRTPEAIANYVKTMYEAVRDDLYYVESMHYFRMYDDYATTWGSNAEKYFGLFYDPVNKKEMEAGQTQVSLAEPKPGAIAYQQVAGGSGSLKLYEDYLKGEYESKFVMHRGLSTEAKENTIDSFTLAAQKSNVYAIETDVYLTSDKKPVLIHDQNTSDLTFGKTKIDVTTSTYDEVRNIRLPDIEGNPNVHQIPSLGEFLNILKTYSKHGFLEFKKDFSSEDLDIILNEINAANLMNNMVFISFFPNVLKLVKQKYPTAKAMVLYNKFSEADLDMLVQNGLGLDCEYQNISEDDILTLKRKNIESCVWCVDSLETAKKFGRLGVDYITSNRLTSFVS